MDVEWEISDFKWNSQNLIAERNDEKPSFIPVVDVPPAKGGSERRAEPVTPVCQVHGCGIAIEQPYYKKYRVCQPHSKSTAVNVAGKLVRFCQKCARFHDVSEFEAEKRSCRTSLAEHNKRRRQVMVDKKHKGEDPDSPGDTSAPRGRSRRVRPSTSGPDARAAVDGRDATQHHSGSGDAPLSSLGGVSSGRDTTGGCDTPDAHSTDPLEPKAEPQDSVPIPQPGMLGFTLVSLLSPLASALHEWEQVLPEAMETMAPPAPSMIPTPVSAGFFYSDDPVVSYGGGGADTQAMPGTPARFVPVAGATAGTDSTLSEAWQGIGALGAGVPDGKGSGSGPGAPPGGDRPLLGDGGRRSQEGRLSGEDLQQYVPSDAVVRLSLKLFACTPDQLPSTMRPSLENSFLLNPTLMEGYLRPGCTHLALDMRVPMEVAVRLQSADLASSVETLLRNSPELAACAQTASLVQLGNSIVGTRNGRVLHTVSVTGPAAPSLGLLTPVCVAKDEGGGVRVNLIGRHIRRAGDLVLCREHGKYVSVEMLDESVWGHMEDSALDGVSEGEDCGASATSVLEFPVGEAGSADGEEEGESPSAASRAPTMAPDVAAAVAIGAVPVRIFGLRCGVAELEVQHGGVLTQARPLLVLPNAEAAAEVERLAAKARGADWVDAFLRDVGLVVGYLQGEGAAGQCSAEVVAPIAARTVEFSLERGCTALARLLQPALAEESGQCGGRSSDAFAAAASCNPPAQKSTWEELGAKMGAMGQSLKGAAAALCAATGVSDFAAARTAAIEREVLRNVDVRGNGGMDWGWVPAAAATFCGLAAAVAARNWGGA